MQLNHTVEEHQVELYNFKTQELDSLTSAQDLKLTTTSQQDAPPLSIERDIKASTIRDKALIPLPQFAQASSSLMPNRVLVVEDDDTNRQLLSDYLAFHGYTPYGVGTGVEFPHALHEFCPNVILLDIRLPDVSGYTLLSQVKHHPTWSQVPVIIVSAYAFRSDQARALELGASQYFVKPVDLPQLLDAINVELQRIRERSSSL